MKTALTVGLLGLCALLLASCAPQKNIEPKIVNLKLAKSFPVLEYHQIGRPEGRWQRTPENFRRDLEWLYENGYYPMDLRDLLTNFAGLPQGKIPVILTFDDSTIEQFRYLNKDQIDPDSAVGILKAFHDKHPADWPLRATFFILIETNAPEHNLFGQPEFAAKKLRQLTEWGMEVGSHTYSHDRFDKMRRVAAIRTLGRSVKKLRELSGQEIVSLSMPLGIYPKDMSVFSGEYEGTKYHFQLAAKVSSGLQAFPWDKKFDPLHINRIQALDSEWRIYLKRK